jgi:hypothetical protein
MTWKRNAKYIIIYFVATFLSTFPFGFINGFLSNRGHTPPSWLGIGQFLSVVVASILVFIFFAKSQETQVWQNGIAIVLLSWGISFPLNVLLLGIPFSTWALSLIYIFIFMAIGVAIGRQLYLKKAA